MKNQNSKWDPYETPPFLAEGHGQPAALDLLSALGNAVAYGQATADCLRYLESQLPDGKTLDAPTKK